MLMLPIDTIGQCTAPDIEIKSNTTWQNSVIRLNQDQRIIVTDGATLTIKQCTLTLEFDCHDYWDGIHLVTDGNGDKAALHIEESLIELSKNGIQAANGFEDIALIETEMRYNGQMLNVTDSWPFTSAGPEIGTGELTGPGTVLDPGCAYTTPPPKVTITDSCIFAVDDHALINGPLEIQRQQITVLGGELKVASSEILNQQDEETRDTLAAINASRGKCQVYGTKIDGFWTGIYKGSDANAFCVSEGLILTGSEIVNTMLVNSDGDPDLFGMPGWAVYNLTSNALLRGNILEANVWSMGISYGSLTHNNIYYAPSTEINSTSVRINEPEESFDIRDNRLYKMYAEFEGDNARTDVTCNTWESSRYAVVAGLENVFPMSWGTAKQSAGNVWDQLQSEMYNLSIIDDEVTYYFYQPNSNEIFKFEDGFAEQTADIPNGSCTYTWPANFSELDTIEYTLSMDSLEGVYDDVLDSIAYIIANEDTTETEVKEELAYYERSLSDLIGKGMLFNTEQDSQFWKDEVNQKVLELQGLNRLWYGLEMDTILNHLNNKSDSDAQVLYEAADIVSVHLKDSADLYDLNVSTVDSLQDLAESSFGDYTNLLRSFLYLVYDVFVPWPESGLIDSVSSGGSLIQLPLPNEESAQAEFSVAPNPFQNQIEVYAEDEPIAELQCLAQVFNLEGKLIYSTAIPCHTGRLNLGSLQPGIYLLRIENDYTGKVAIQRIFKQN